MGIGIALFSCGGKEGESSTPGSSAGAGPAAVSVDLEGDGGIAAIAQVINDGEMLLGQLALTQAADVGVMRFATRLVRDHAAIRKRQGALFTRLGITLSENPTSQGLRGESRAAIMMLRGVQGPPFDRLYIDEQVTTHRRLLKLFDSELLPRIQHAEVHDDLLLMRGAMAAHLQLAEGLKARLSRATSLRFSDLGFLDLH
jgi:putative membrane protein